MSGFKDMLERDLAVFLNTGEFADLRMVEGRGIAGIPDGEGLEGMADTVGIVGATLLISAAMEDRPPREPPGALLNVDGVDYTIEQWDGNKGMAAIALSMPTSG